MRVIEVTLENSGGELDRREVIVRDDDDIAEVSSTIWNEIEDWILAPGDTIKVKELEFKTVEKQTV